jgi:dihydrofolate synthase/folylpolyglutamate synthase
VTFEEAMTLVEVQHTFPERLEDFHNRRAAELFEQTGLSRELQDLPTVVVAGSCGKASTARYLAECVASLYSLTGLDKPVGLGTKPPLHETLDGNRERYQVLRDERTEWIPPHTFAELVQALPAELPDGIAPYDLRSWLLARYFLHQGVGLGIVEANIGLRDDPAALWPSPAAYLLTPIGVDHVGLLRPDGAPAQVLALGDRAGPVWHKFCGLPAGGRLVCGLQDRDVADLVADYEGTLLLAGRDFRCRISTQSLSGTRATFELGEMAPLEVELQTIGRHQAENACQAAACLWLLCNEGILQGSPQQLREAIRRGLARAKMPGRMERISLSPTVLLNAATGQIKLKGMIETLEEAVESQERVWIVMSVEKRLVGGDAIPKWLDVSLDRILSSPVIAGFTATATPEDIEARRLADWARQRSRGDTPIDHLPPERALQRATGAASVVILVGQTLSDLGAGDS